MLKRNTDMKKLWILGLSGLLLSTACSDNIQSAETNSVTTGVTADTTQQADLTEVIAFEGHQVTGVTITEDGRMFANFPRWREGVPFSVVEVMPNGSFKPYPNESWNSWSGQPQPQQFTCVQSVVAHRGSLYVLDPASPMMQGVVGKARLFEFDLATNQLKNKWEFSSDIAPTKSYLNDLRVDERHGKIYITDSGLGALVVLDPATGEARRLLANHASTKAENVNLRFEGQEWTQNGKQPQVHADGIALSPNQDSLYYHALTGYTLYRVPTTALADASLAPDALQRQVQDLGKTPAPDGMIFDSRGNLYMADLENNSIVYRTPAGELKTLVQDNSIRWADTFTLGSDNMLYFTTSRINEASGDISNLTFSIYKTPLAQ